MSLPVFKRGLLCANKDRRQGDQAQSQNRQIAHRDGGKLILETYSHVRPEHSQRMAALMTTERPANVVEMQAATGNVIETHEHKANSKSGERDKKPPCGEARRLIAPVC
jgi:hypothetical protein